MSEKVEAIAKEVMNASPAVRALVEMALHGGTIEAPILAGKLDAESLTATQNLVIRLSDQEEELKAKKKNINEMMKSIFDNDDQLTIAQSLADAQLKAAKERKNELRLSSQVTEMKSKIEDINEDLKMVRESLNTHLINYFQLTGSQTVDFPGGEEREMSIRAKMKSLAKNPYNKSKPVKGQTDIFGGEAS